ncbi:flavin reductase family protein [Streptomyces sp. NPDC090445]|uniref:flavin reductase family protein n=1 Tax=Streptomyces sp. NPDC090445 TaxID=3365963 RepID=UPI0038062673
MRPGSGSGAGPTDVTDPGQLRQIFGTFATGITVLTVGGAAPHGMTANSFTSVSLEPPLVLVCVADDALMHKVLESADHFGISILAAGQDQVARHFSDRSRPQGLRQFDAVRWRPGPATGAPLIDDALAHLECAMWRHYDGGDHTIFLGEVVRMRRRPDQDALLFAGGRYGRLAPSRREAVA